MCVCVCLQPVQTEYRNKCEFSIGVSMETDPPHPVVGFRLGSYEKGEFTVVAADSCVHIPERMKELARVSIDGRSMHESTVYS